MSAGSGVIVDADKGYILTNHHVVDGASEIAVTLKDRRRFNAELVGSDKATDVALLRVDASNLTALRLGDPSRLRRQRGRHRQSVRARPDRYLRYRQRAEP